MGPCQSYFHQECLAKSEKRYYKSEPLIKLKRTTNKRTKRHYSKSKKAKNLNTRVSTIIESNPDKLCNKDDSLASVIMVSNMKSCSDDPKEEDKLQNQLTSNDLSANINCIPSENDNVQLFNELENANEDSVQEIPKEKVVDIPNKCIDISSNNEQVFKSESKNICSLCKANKTNCFVCGLDIEDPKQKLVCKLCKFNIIIFFLIL